MLFPRSYAWTSQQRRLIVAGVIVVLIAFSVIVYSYERYYRGPDESIIVGTWQMEDGCIDCTNLVALERNHNVIAFSDSLAGENKIEYRGRWYAGGQLIVIHFWDNEHSGGTYWKIIDIARDALRVRIAGKEFVFKRSDKKP